MQPPHRPPDAPDPFVGLLRAVAADRVRDAASARARTNWLVRQSEEGGTLAGVLADLAERDETVVCTTRSGRRHVGRVQALGADFVALRASAGATVLVALGSVAQVRTRPGAATVHGDRAVRDDRRLAEVLTDLSADRPDVTMATGSVELRGELRAVGRDVVTLRIDGRPATAVYVAIATAEEVRVG